MDVEATAAIGAGRYEHTGSRVTERNGSRSGLLTTHAGDVQLVIPKLPVGSFFPSILSPWRGIDQALDAVVMEAYVHGVSTRSVDDLVIALGGTGVSKSEVWRICAGLDEQVEAFRTRRLDQCSVRAPRARRSHRAAERSTRHRKCAANDPTGDIPSGVRLTAYSGNPSDLPATVLQEFLDIVSAGDAVVPIGRIFGLDEIQEAHRVMQNNTGRRQNRVLTRDEG